MKTILESFAEYFSNARFEQLPPEVVQKAKLLIVDYLGVSIAGLKMDFPRMTIDYLQSLEGVEQATLMGSARKVPAIHAALGNGVAGHALDMDDGFRYGGVHAGVAVIPAALALAESLKLDGKQLILSIVCGYEIVNRIAKAMNPSHLGRGFHTTGTLGVLGAAAACGVLAKLNASQMASALGMATLQGAGLLEILNDGAMVKPLHPGKAAMAGVLSIELAKRGATGPLTALEGEKGMFKAMADSVNTDGLLDGLGSDFFIMGQYIKFHAACRHIHPAIDGLLDIMRKEHLSYQDIDALNITTYPVAISFCGTSTAPETAEAAKFSLASSCAMAAFYGDAGEERYSVETVQNREIQQLATRVTSSANARWADAYPRERGADIALHTTSGKKFLTQVPLSKGEPENPASDEDFIRKFTQNTLAQPDSLRSQILEMSLALDSHEVSSLTALLGKLQGN
ncbi:MAG: MmgE/PrpD family protein [Burkholderiaceae bacterium]|nr:MmgE/PrpD family protein [Burkholderiaceae bacterium]